MIRIIVDLLSQLPKWFVNLAAAMILICGAIFVYIAVDSLFISKQRYQVLGMTLGPETTFDGRKSTLTMIKADHRAITQNECLKLAKSAFEENDYKEVQLLDIYAFAQYSEGGGVWGYAGIDCGNQNTAWVNVAISIAGRTGQLNRAKTLRDYFYQNTQLMEFE